MPASAAASRRPVLVIGGGRGIGKAVLSALSPDAVSWTRSGGVDAADPASVAKAWTGFAAQHGAPWGIVHTVGYFLEKPLLESSEADLESMLRSNLVSAFLPLRAAVPAMVQAGRGGRVVLMAAAGAGRHRGLKRAPLYFAVKAALVQMARALAVEVAEAGITVNVVSPGLIDHPDSHQESQQRMLAKVPSGRLGRPDDLVGLVQFLLSDQSSYLTGEDITVDGGLQLG